MRSSFRERGLRLIINGVQICLPGVVIHGCGRRIGSRFRLGEGDTTGRRQCPLTSVIVRESLSRTVGYRGPRLVVKRAVERYYRSITNESISEERCLGICSRSRWGQSVSSFAVVEMVAQFRLQSVIEQEIWLVFGPRIVEADVILASGYGSGAILLGRLL